LNALLSFWLGSLIGLQVHGLYGLHWLHGHGPHGWHGVHRLPPPEVIGILSTRMGAKSQRPFSAFKFIIHHVFFYSF
jgi:hypothetical protein